MLLVSATIGLVKIGLFLGHHVLLYDIRPPMKIWEENAENFTKKMESCISGITAANSDLIARENLDLNDKISPKNDAFNAEAQTENKKESHLQTEAETEEEIKKSTQEEQSQCDTAEKTRERENKKKVNEEMEEERKIKVDVLFQANRGEGSITFIQGDICNPEDLRKKYQIVAYTHTHTHTTKLIDSLFTHTKSGCLFLLIFYFLICLRNYFLCWNHWNGDVTSRLDAVMLFSSRAGSDISLTT